MVKLTYVVVLVLFAFVKLGSSLQCYKCSGELAQCNRELGKENCAAGFTYCTSMMLNSADSMHFIYGCAKPQDCQAAKAACAEVTKESQTACSVTCCSGDNCATPYEKDFNPRKCYHCTSMEECEMAKPQICSNSTDRCYKISTDVTYKDSNVQLKTYSKGCATQSQCENKDAHVFHQTCTEDSTCDMTCCEDDMCNAGSHVVVSVFTLLACALLAVVRL